jgi:hypothetical protein
LPNLYNYAYDNISKTYNFTTKFGIIYRIAFIEDDTFSSISGGTIQNIFQLVIDKATDEKEPLDNLVSATVTEIVYKFFSGKKNSLIFFCSDDDGKGLLRFKVFDRWYKNSKYNTIVIKKDNVISIQSDKSAIVTLHTSFLYHKENQDKELLMAIYESIEQVLNQDK